MWRVPDGLLFTNLLSYSIWPEMLKLSPSTWNADIGGWWLTYSAKYLKSSITSSYVSPNIGLNVFRVRLLMSWYITIEWMVQSAKRLAESSVFGFAAVFMRSFGYISISQVRWRVVMGSAKMTGMDTFERSCPIDFLMMSHIDTFSFGSLKFGSWYLLSLLTRISESLNFGRNLLTTHWLKPLTVVRWSRSEEIWPNEWCDSPWVSYRLFGLSFVSNYLSIYYYF